MSTPLVVSQFYPLQQYKRGKDCKVSTLVDNKDLSIKLENMCVPKIG